MKATTRTLVTLLLLASVLLAAPEVADAAPGGGGKPPTSACPPGKTPAYPPGQCTLAVSANSVVVGATVDVSGCGFGPSTSVVISLAPSKGKTVRLATVTASGGGCIAATVTIPAGAKPGTYKLKARGTAPNGGDYELVSDTITVTPAAVPLDAEGVAYRGPTESSSGQLASVLAGLALAVLGSFAIVKARQRKADAARP